MWFFQKGFAFRISERFQSMSEFTSELMRFADTSGETSLDAIEQFKMLNQNVEKNDRNVQLIALRSKYNDILTSIRQALAAKLNPINSLQGSFNFGGFALTPQHKIHIPKGELLTVNTADSYTISRLHFNGAALALLIGLAEGMDIHLYATGYTTPLTPEKLIEWSKIAVVEESQKVISDRTRDVVADVLANKLAHEIRNLNLKREQK